MASVSTACLARRPPGAVTVWGGGAPPRDAPPPLLGGGVGTRSRSWSISPLILSRRARSTSEWRACDFLAGVGRGTRGERVGGLRRRVPTSAGVSVRGRRGFSRNAPSPSPPLLSLGKSSPRLDHATHSRFLPGRPRAGSGAGGSGGGAREPRGCAGGGAGAPRRCADATAGDARADGGLTLPAAGDVPSGGVRKPAPVSRARRSRSWSIVVAPHAVPASDVLWLPRGQGLNSGHLDGGGGSVPPTGAPARAPSSELGKVASLCVFSVWLFVRAWNAHTHTQQ